MAKQQQKTKNQNENFYIFSLYGISVICGAALMALEIAGGRMLSPFFGSSVYVWGSIISVFLTALSVGYYYGGILADKQPNLTTLGLVIGLSGVLVFLVPFMLPFMVSFAYGAKLGAYGALVVSILLFCLPSIGLGMVSPYIVKLGVLEASKVGKLVGRFYSVSTFGSIIGTLGTTFILTPIFGVRKVIYAIGILLIILTVLIFIFHKMFQKTAVCLLLLFSGTYMALVYPPGMALYAAEGQMLYERESLYNNLAVVDDPNGMRYLLFNETQQSAMRQDRPEEHIWPYTYLMTAAADYYRPKSGRELLIGLGGGTIPKYTDVARPQVKMDTVEIDPEVLRVAKEYFYLKENEQIHNYVDDGRLFLQDKKNLYDVVYIDAFNRTGIPFHLTTTEFFQQLAKAMTPDGAVVINVVSGVEGENGKFFKSLLKTVDQVFENRKFFLAESRPGPEYINNIILVASNGNLSGDQVNNFTVYKDKVNLDQAIVLTDDYAPVDTLAASIMMK